MPRKDEAFGDRLSRSQIAGEIIENLCSIFRVDSHSVADHLLDGGAPAVAAQSTRSDDHGHVVTGSAHTRSRLGPAGKSEGCASAAASIAMLAPKAPNISLPPLVDASSFELLPANSLQQALDAIDSEPRRNASG